MQAEPAMAAAIDRLSEYQCMRLSADVTCGH